jgi:multidrug efflux pump subunit AcrA (membrane-fusion protein)
MAQVAAPPLNSIRARLFPLLIFIGGIGLAVSFPIWKHFIRNWQVTTEETQHDDHAGHDHSDHGDENKLEMSKQAQASIGLKIGEVKLSNYERTISIPGIVQERPGRSRLQVTAPVTGIVTQIDIATGHAVKPGDLMFEIRLTHEELVQAQAQLLSTVEQIDVIRSEITRLEEVTKDGAVAAKTLRERQYELQKEEASLRAQKQSLLLHQLNTTQIEDIIRTRLLLQSMQVRVPAVESSTQDEMITSILLVQELLVDRGEQINAGEPLAILADHSQLLIAGEAFEQDTAAISQTKAEHRAITAILEDNAHATQVVQDLKISFLENKIDANSRTQHFFVLLPNQLLGDPQATQTGSFVEWKFKPGQRMQLRVPVERWSDRIVLPAEAVAQDGVENYVFFAGKGYFKRIAVQVEHRDAQDAVIANDGTLKLGASIAMNGAQQMLLALKNKLGGGVDPHAGHNH